METLGKRGIRVAISIAGAIHCSVCDSYLSRRGSYLNHGDSYLNQWFIFEPLIVLGTGELLT